MHDHGVDSQLTNEPETQLKRFHLSREEGATLGVVASVLGIASAYTQLFGAGIHGWFRLAVVCLLLAALTVGVAILVKRLDRVSLPWAALVVVLAAVGGGGLGYYLRGSGAGPAKTGAAAAANSKSELTGAFENTTPVSTGCMVGLRFVLDREPAADRRIWIMVRGATSEVYPESRLDFAGKRATAASFPIGSADDTEGAEFEVLSVMLDVATSDRYEEQARTSGTFPVESAGPPGVVLNRFTVHRDNAYVACG